MNCRKIRQNYVWGRKIKYGNEREKQNMLMWYVILGIVIISAGAGLIYLSDRVARFGFMKMFDRNGNNAQCRKTAGFVLILLIFAALSLTINLVNAVVCLLHFVCIELL